MGRSDVPAGARAPSRHHPNGSDGACQTLARFGLGLGAFAVIGPLQVLNAWRGMRALEQKQADETHEALQKHRRGSTQEI